MLKNARFHVLEDNTTTPHSNTITDDEANALRLLCCWICTLFFLKKKLRHRPEFHQCLNNMAIERYNEEEETKSYIEFTMEWLERVNRGE